jgi:hypothetical protein
MMMLLNLRIAIRVQEVAVAKNLDSYSEIPGFIFCSGD